MQGVLGLLLMIIGGVFLYDVFSGKAQTLLSFLNPNQGQGSNDPNNPTSPSNPLPQGIPEIPILPLNNTITPQQGTNQNGIQYL